jgi:glucans biosynthesis protein
LIEAAERLARAPFQAGEPKLPGFLERIDYEAHREIRFRPSEALWRQQNLPFAAHFFHLGAFYKRSVQIHEVADGQARLVLFEPSLFDYGKIRFDESVPETLGFAGFRLHHHLNRADFSDELAVFLGASYFRSIGRDQTYGLSARGLAIDTGMPTGEEFPFFREFYLERPGPGATQIALHALLDSKSMTGAYRFVIAPGLSTVMEISATLFARRKVERLGLAPLTSMFLHGGPTPPRGDDFRPRVHDSQGLSIWHGSREWIWRPLGNPRRLRLSVYRDNSLRGFGLLQRLRTFSTYNDLDARYEKRPSAWVEPVEGFGPGAVWLVEIPSDSEINDNIVAFWSPATLPEGGARMDLSYRLHWGAETPHRPAVAEVIDTKAGRGGLPSRPDSGSRKFVIDFRGGTLGRLGDARQLDAAITASEGKVSGVSVQPLPEPASWRLTFDFKAEGSRPQELRAHLKSGADILTETWSYQWNP